MKGKYKKIAAAVLAVAVVAAVSAYTWLPGTKTVAKQGVKATKAAAAHYLSTEAVDASNIRHEAFCQVLFGVIDAQSRRKRESAKRKGSALCVFSLRVRAAASS